MLEGTLAWTSWAAGMLRIDDTGNTEGAHGNPSDSNAGGRGAHNNLIPSPL